MEKYFNIYSNNNNINHLIFTSNYVLITLTLMIVFKYD